MIPEAAFQWIFGDKPQETRRFWPENARNWTQESGHWIRSSEYHGTGRFRTGLFDLGKQQYPLTPFDTSHPNQ